MSGFKISRILSTSIQLSLLLVLPAVTGASPVHSRNMQTVDSLFAAGAYDTVAALIPPLLDHARSSGDSTDIARLLVLRGRIELSRDAGMAESTLEEARLIASSSRDTANWSDALGFKSIAAAFLGRFEESIALNKARLALTVASKDPAGEAWARAGLGYVYLKTGAFEEAEREYSEAAEIFRSGGRTREELTALVGLGRALNALGRTDSARDVYLRVWRASGEIGDPSRESEALNNLGNIEYEHGDMAVAASYFERAYELDLSRGDVRGTIVPATNVALAKSYLGHHSDAAEILSQALARCEERGYRDLVGMVLSTLGQVRLSQGRPNDSARIYRRALALEEGLTRKQHDDAVYGLARALASGDRFESAAEVLSGALSKGPLPEFEPGMGQFLSRCLRRLGRHEEALERALAASGSAERSGSLEDRFLTSIELSSAYRENEDLRHSYEWYLRSVDVLGEFRRSTGVPEWREAHGRIRALVDGGLVLLEYPESLPFEKRTEVLFDVLQRFKARTLSERMAGGETGSGQVTGRGASATACLSVLMDEVLEPGELFIDFAVGDSVTLLFAVTADSCRLVRLPGRDSGLPEKISFFLDGLGSPYGGKGGPLVDADGIDRMGISVYRLLLGEIHDLVSGAERVLISPDDRISAVPFGMLGFPDRVDGARLMDSAEIEYLPSATVLARLRERPGRRREKTGGGTVLALLPCAGGRMKGVEKEVETIREILLGVRVMEGKPDLPRLEEGPEGFEVLHVAAHFVANNEKPWFSGILLGPGEGGYADQRKPAGATDDVMDPRVPVDPYLRAGDIAAHRIPARLAVLSGCRSALGRTSSGEGVLGLTSAFLSAGVPVVVSTSWPVDDMVTAELMSIFYERLADGETVSAALRSAQYTIKRSRATGHPFYWAGFVVVGDGSTEVDIRRAASFPGVGTVTAALVLLSLFLLLLSSLAARGKETGR